MKWILARLVTRLLNRAFWPTFQRRKGNCRQQVDSLAVSCSTERSNSSSTTKNSSKYKFQHLLTFEVLFQLYLKTTSPLNLHNFN